MARQALEATNGDTREAEERLISMIRQDAGVLEPTIDDLLQQLARARVADAMRARRQGYWGQSSNDTHGQGAPTPANPKPGNVIGLHARAMRNLLDYPIQGGKRLGDASRAEVQEQAGMHRQLAETNAKRARWFDRIARAMGDAETVGAVLDHARLQALQREAETE
jgi:hypothetical protein